MKHLIKFVALSLVAVFSLTSCEQEAVNVTENSGIIGLALTEDGQKTYLDNTVVNTENVVPNNVVQDRSLTFRNDKPRHVLYKSKGSIDDYKAIRRIKWDVTYDTEKQKIYGDNAKFTYKSDDLFFNVTMKNVCTFLANDAGTKHIIAFRVKNLKKFKGSGEDRKFLESNPYIFFWAEDRGMVNSGKHDKFSNINFLNGDVVDELLADYYFGLDEIDFCYAMEYLVYSENDLSHQPITKESLADELTNKVPSDDWLIIKSIKE